VPDMKHGILVPDLKQWEFSARSEAVEIQCQF
jgi:hypothetical protein